jgi:hypothetical protein
MESSIIPEREMGGVEVKSSASSEATTKGKAKSKKEKSL